jgi:hypothetical protein
VGWEVENGEGKNRPGCMEPVVRLKEKTAMETGTARATGYGILFHTQGAEYKYPIYI